MTEYISFDTHKHYGLVEGEDVVGYPHENRVTLDIIAPFFRSASRLYRKVPCD